MYHHISSTKNQFVGQSLQSIDRIDQSEVRINLTNGEKWKLGVRGDCCSHSIFYDIILPQECIGSEILDLLEFVEGQTEEEVIAQFKDKFSEFFASTDCLKIWDVVFKTRTGNILIRHINDSNGYYDGSTGYTKE